MALVWEREAMMEDGVYRFIFDVRWDNVTNAIDRVRIYPQSSRERLILRQEGIADRVVSIPPRTPAVQPPLTLGANTANSILLTTGFGPYRYNPDGGDGFVSIELREDTDRRA